jgi:hypothetical protein
LNLDIILYSDLSTHPNHSLLDLDAAKRTRNNPSTGREHEPKELFVAKVEGRWLAYLQPFGPAEHFPLVGLAKAEGYLL